MYDGDMEDGLGAAYRHRFSARLRRERPLKRRTVNLIKGAVDKVRIVRCG